ncbi:MAG: WecB/TagA/CpsF family glycosyltransferase [Candidatus Hydrogenedentales bacterium]
MSVPVLATHNDAGVLLSDAPRLQVQRLFGVDMHSVTLEDVFSVIDAQIKAQRPSYIVTPNVDHICRLQYDAVFQQAYRASVLSLPDGVPIIWASHFFRKPLQQKISGSDLVYWLSEHAARRGHRVFFFGAPPGVAQDAARRLRKRYPGLRVAGAYCPPLGFEQLAHQSAAALDANRAPQPAICLVALGTPKQELWMHDSHRELGVPVLLGIGAGLDFVCGTAKRAPRLMQRMGLEWLWRLCHDPRRLAPRYLMHDSQFLLLLLHEWRKARIERRQVNVAKDSF